MAKKKTARTPVESIRPKGMRKNIFVEDLRDFVVDDEHAPKEPEGDIVLFRSK
jgi:hypothetical protein